MLLSKEQKERDKLLEQIYNKTIHIAYRMSMDKKNILEKIEKHINKSGISLSECGNITLVNSEGTIKIQFVVQDYVIMDEKLEAAKKIIDGCIEKWSTGAKKKEYVAGIIKKAFNVEKKGAINKNSILKLTKLNIKDADWEKAMELILDSITIINKKQYMIIYERNSKNDKWERINLNWSAI